MRIESFRKQPFLVLVPIVLALSGAPASAQGSNECATATPISGFGAFAVDTTGATDSAQQTGACATAHNDVWFVYSATVTQLLPISLCGGTSADTIIAVYPGSGCPLPGTQLACSDDTCGTQSAVTIGAVGGNSYLIQIGAKNPGTTFSGTFNIGIPPPPPCGANTGPDIVVGDLQDIANYTGQTIGGVPYDAVAFGTYSCNVGTVWCNW